jgi:hypothetical protein
LDAPEEAIRRRIFREEVVESDVGIEPLPVGE